MKFKQKGFTLIELIVVMAIIAILVLIASPKFMGYTEKAKLTQVINDIKVSEKAAEQYYLQNDLWPRDQAATPYTDEQLTLWVDDFRNLSGETVTLDDGKYYDVDWELMKPFMAKPENNFKYIIQNPVGDIYYAYELTPAGEQTKFSGDSQLTTEPEPTTEANLAPVAAITMTPETNLFTNTTITWSTSNSTDQDGDLIVNSEWEGKQNIYVAAGTYTVKLRVQDSKGLWSKWIEKTFNVIDSDGVKKIVAGQHHTVALMNDGTVKTWGFNQMGQLGIDTNNGTNTPNPTPTTIPGLTNVNDVIAGIFNTFAIMNDGTVKAWGYNHVGQLGIDTNVGSSTQIPTTIPGLTNVKEIIASSSHTLALMNDGTVKAWGQNYHGQLGTTTNNYTNTVNTTPTTIPGLTTVKKIASGENNTIALKTDGTVWSFGYNKYGQLGIAANTNPNPIPTIVPGLIGVKEISAGLHHTVALLNDGTVKAWGRNKYGQLGITTNNSTDNPTSSPRTVSGFSNVKEIVAVGLNTFVLFNDGTVNAWGYNYHGQLGITTNIGTQNANATPTTIPGLTDVNKLVAGYAHIFAIINDGTVKVWGYNQYGQLGITINSGTGTPTSTPTTVPVLMN